MLPFINESPIPVLYAPFKTYDVRAASEADQTDASATAALLASVMVVRIYVFLGNANDGAVHSQA